MDYDPSKIKKKTIIIDGKEVPLFVIPTGMRGAQYPAVEKDDIVEEEEITTDETEDREEIRKYYDHGEYDDDISETLDRMPEHETISGLFDNVEY